jgi:hypothetical protein
VLEASRQLEAVDPRNIQIRHHHMGTSIEGALERLQSVVSLVHTKSRIGQPVGVHSPSVPIVFDEQHNGRRVGRGHWCLPDQVYGAPVREPKRRQTVELWELQHLPRLDEVRIAELVTVQLVDAHIGVGIAEMLFCNFAERIASFHRVSLAGRRGRRAAAR